MIHSDLFIFCSAMGMKYLTRRIINLLLYSASAVHIIGWHAIFLFFNALWSEPFKKYMITEFFITDLIL